MQDPADGVVDKLGLRVGLVTTFVGDDPETGGDETCPEGIQRPERELGRTVQDRVWKLDNLGMDTGIEESGRLIDSSQGNKIRDAEGIYASDFVCQRTNEKETDT
jgi:hypothetical protein